MKKIIIIILFLVLINLVYAQEIEVIKEAKNNIFYQDNLEVNIKFKNPYNNSRIFSIKEILPQGISLVNPDKAEIELHNGIKVNIYNWEINASPNNIVTINYIIKPNNLGSYTLRPSIIKDKLNNNIYLSNSFDFI